MLISVSDVDQNNNLIKPVFLHLAANVPASFAT